MFFSLGFDKRFAETVSYSLSIVFIAHESRNSREVVRFALALTINRDAVFVLRQAVSECEVEQDMGQHDQISGVRPVQGLRVAAEVFIVLSVCSLAVSTWSSWKTYAALRQSREPSASTLADKIDLAINLVAALVFLLWLWRARCNAELLDAAPQRRARFWTFWGWVVPVVHLWFPHTVVTDVWLASIPRRMPPHVRVRLVNGARRTVRWWWAMWLGGPVLSGVAHVVLETRRSADVAGLTALADTVAAVVVVVSAMLVVRIMREVTAWQSRYPSH